MSGARISPDFHTAVPSAKAMARHSLGSRSPMYAPPTPPLKDITPKIWRSHHHGPFSSTGVCARNMIAAGMRSSTPHQIQTRLRPYASESLPMTGDM